jgi:hypothetical protein
MFQDCLYKVWTGPRGDLFILMGKNKDTRYI